MAKNIKHSWDPPEWLKDPVASISYFHDAKVEVYEGTAKVNDIRLWRHNYRTLLDIRQLKEIGGKEGRLTDKKVIEYIFSEGLHKISDLAKSVKMNGVRVPLVLSDRKELLDGNRRFLACNYLSKNEKPSEESFKYEIVPVRCVPPDLEEEVRLKIISEMNFLDPHKEPWPRQVRAEFAKWEYELALKELGDEDEAYDRVSYLLSIRPAELKRFLAVLEIIKEFCDYVKKTEGKKAHYEAQLFARVKFHFFEEFYNKALYGKNCIKETLIKESKELLFRYFRNQQIVSTTAVRNFASIVRYDPSMKILKKKTGSFVSAKLQYDDYAGSKRISQKVSRFCIWFEGLSSKDQKDLSEELKKRLLKVVKKVAK